MIPAFLCPPARPRPAGPPLELEVGTGSLYRLGTELLQITVTPGSRLHGVFAAELRLPVGSTLGLVARAGSTHALQPTTQLRTDDVLLVFTRPDQRGTAEKRILAVHRTGRLARWHGDTGE
ncbi:MAG: TrkA C-terminal domain-containing protein [Nocardioides sp.]